MVHFEAAVAGGIPVIKALREGLAANQIQSVAGIINGTSNFILSEMREKAAHSKMYWQKRNAWAMPKPTPLLTLKVMTLDTKSRL